MERYDVNLDDSIVNMKQKVILVVDPSLSFLEEFEETKAHNMMGLMMDAQHKDKRLLFLHLLVKNKALNMSMNMMESHFKYSVVDIQSAFTCILHVMSNQTQ